MNKSALENIACFAVTAALLVMCVRASGADAPSAADDALDLRQVLLRQSSITVSPGQWQVEAGLDYSRSVNGVSGGGQSVNREMEFADELRLGVTDWMEVFAGLPFVYATRDIIDTNGYHSASASGIGDADAGASVLLLKESENLPAAMFMLDVSIPTGGSPYDHAPNTAASTGAGVTEVRGMFNFVRSSDPLAIYWGLGYEYFSSATMSGTSIAPGGAVVYRAGMGFSVNRDVSIIAETDGDYQFEPTVGGKTLDGSTTEPVSFRIGLTCRLTGTTYLEPDVTFGVTPEAPDFVAGLTLVSRGMF